MATKKASTVKTSQSSGRKKAAKKTTTKLSPLPGGKVSAKKIAKPATALVKKVAVKKVAAKKTTVIKKAATPKKTSVAKKTASKKVAAKTTKALPEKSIKNSFLKKGAKNTSKAIEKSEFKGKKDANQLLVDAAVEGILEVKGRDISVLDLRGINNRVCDYYIICEADSSTQVNAIAGSVEVMVKKRIGERPYHTEGFQNSEWILVDYVTVVVHVFQSQVREFYNLESLWADAEVTRID